MSAVTGGEPLLALEHIRKSFPGAGKGDAAVKVLDGVTLQVGSGEFVAILGPSGSGKTTLFRLIGGLLQPDSGAIRLGGEDIAGQRGRIGYMPQQPSLLPWRNVLDNVLMAAEIAGISRKEAEPKAREWLVRAGLGGCESAYPHELSGGMQQRASFVRALLGPQQLLCLDEPFGALDAMTRLEMQLWLGSLWQESGRAVLLVTHSIDEALLLADRVYVLSAKPATVLEEVKVPWPHPRSEANMAEPQFVRLRQQLYDVLRKAKEVPQR
ncbi:ABC transporter ATP-binding protein [Gordoniibacillus kamchatkensis]|uniref:ABC transporter ATP-binding protein n=1 Tax=Gordoniibacillus kamchatkensis TaxID=1590651 RepID=UPI000A4225D6|nr:ABC transporter ATP-binding protein [Paenibacillus sp. VKM B-2647]